MDGPGFRNYYLSTVKNSNQSDLNYFFYAWETMYGTFFNNSTPWRSTNPEYRVPRILKSVETRMISNGCDAAVAKRVIKCFKGWYADLYSNY